MKPPLPPVLIMRDRHSDDDIDDDIDEDINDETVDIPGVVGDHMVTNSLDCFTVGLHPANSVALRSGRFLIVTFSSVLLT